MIYVLLWFLIGLILTILGRIIIQEKQGIGILMFTTLMGPLAVTWLVASIMLRLDDYEI